MFVIEWIWIVYLLPSAMKICKEESGIEIEYLEVDPLPMLNTDLETPNGGFPPVVEAFRRKILHSDCILFASPEYNYSIAGLSLSLNKLSY